MTTTTLLHGLALAAAGGLGLAAGYWFACLRHAARLTRSAARARTELSRRRDAERHATRKFRADLIARMDQQAVREGHRAGGLERSKVA